MKRRGKYIPQQEQAALEQQQAARVTATVDRVEHFLMLQLKFGPKAKP